MTGNQGTYAIGVVERDTGIGRDTLRIWERRYGFPKPVRNEKGERIYSESQLRRLQRIRRLLDQGMRPGKVLPLSELMNPCLQPEHNWHLLHRRNGQIIQKDSAHFSWKELVRYSRDKRPV